MAEEKTETGAEETKSVSRRGFLKVAAAGAAAAGVAATAPGILNGEMPLSRVFSETPAKTGEPIVAYIGDAATGEIVLMAGEREVRVRDLGVVSWFVRSFAGL